MDKYQSNLFQKNNRLHTIIARCIFMKIILLDLAPRNHLQEPYEHLGLGYLASILRQNRYNVQILSCNCDNLRIRKAINYILSVNPDLLGISVKSIHAKRMAQIVSRLRDRGFQDHITIGGHFPTFHHREILQDLPQIDSVVRGEGEYTILELVERLKDNDFSQICGLSYRNGNEIKINKPRKLIADLDQLPFPARDKTDQVLKKGGFMSISASRGCYANCAFCSIANFYKMTPGKKWRRRSPENVADEIILLIKKFGSNYFKFIDDQLFISDTEAMEYFEALQKEFICHCINIKFIMNCRANNIGYEIFKLLKRTGLQKVFIGVESAHQRGLNTYNKGTTVSINNNALSVLDKLDINYDIGFILIDPYTTYQELHENLRYLCELKQRIKRKRCYLSVSTSLSVYGGTPIYTKLLRQHQLKGNYLQGYNYQVENINVRFFQFIMESIIQQYLLPIYHNFLFIKHLLTRKSHLKFLKLRR